MLNVAQFCSGWGTTMDETANLANNWKLWDIRSKVVIGSKTDIKALSKATKLGIPNLVLNNPRDPKEILSILEKYNIQIASLNGWIPKFPKEAIEEFTSKWGILLNQHPGPVRENWLDFWWGWELGMYWSRVTAARVLYLLSIWAEGEDVFTESTFQHVAPDVDRGLPVWVIKVPFASKLEEFKDDLWIVSPRNLDFIDYKDLENPTVKAIMEFVSDIQDILLPVEHQNVANVFERLWNWESPLKILKWYNEVLIRKEEEDLLIQAKERAVQLFPKG